MLGDELDFAPSDPSFDNALGVRGGVFFKWGDDTPFVSLTDSRLEAKAENAENENVPLVGEEGAVEGRRVVGFERWHA